MSARLKISISLVIILLMGLIIGFQIAFLSSQLYTAYLLFVQHENHITNCDSSLRLPIFALSIIAIVILSTLFYHKYMIINLISLGIEVLILSGANIALSLMNPIAYRCNTPADVIRWVTEAGIFFCVVNIILIGVFTLSNRKRKIQMQIIS